jgi:hypothetical protein
MGLHLQGVQGIPENPNAHVDSHIDDSS